MGHRDNLPQAQRLDDRFEVSELLAYPLNERPGALLAVLEEQLRLFQRGQLDETNDLVKPGVSV